MTYSFSPSVAPSSRPQAGRALAAVREWLQALYARRRDLHVQRREARALRATSEMDAHLLRDIGAPEELIARAIEDRTHLPREFLFQLATVAAVVAVIATPVPALAADRAISETTCERLVQRALPGVFTGEFSDGGPVYRFPSIVVIGSRKVEAVVNEAPLAQHRPARAAATRRPA